MAGHQTYSIAVDGLSAVTFAELRGILGPEGCRQLESNNGIVNLEVTFRETGLALSDVLGLVGASGARIVDCAKHEQSFEEMFSHAVPPGCPPPRPPPSGTRPSPMRGDPSRPEGSPHDRSGPTAVMRPRTAGEARMDAACRALVKQLGLEVDRILSEDADEFLIARCHDAQRHALVLKWVGEASGKARERLDKEAWLLQRLSARGRLRFPRIPGARSRLSLDRFRPGNALGHGDAGRG